MKSIRSVFDIIKKLDKILNIKQKTLGVGVIFLGVIGSIFEVLGVSAIIPLITVILQPEQIMDMQHIGNILTKFDIKMGATVVLIIGGSVILVFLIKNFYFIFLSWIRVKYACKVQRELAIFMFQAYMRRDYTFFLKTNTSQLQRGVIDDTNGVYNVLAFGMKMVIDVLTITLICGYIFLTDWKMAVIVVGVALFCLLFLFSIFRKWMEKGGEIRRNYCAEAVKNIIQAFQGIKEVFIMGRRKYFVKEFENAYSKQLSASIIQGVGNECPAYIIEGICVTGLLGYICICVAGGNIDTESMVVSLAVFAMGAFRILPSLGRISTTFNTIVFYARSMDEMYNNLELARETTKEEEISDREIEFIDSLKIEGLYWKYSEEADYVLEDINLEIKKGDSIAFVGQSGSGKTTLVDLIMGLLKPQRGLITLDGLDILELGNSWRKLIGYVPQNIYLIDDSIRNNIAFGIPEEKIDDEKVWKALELAQLKEFVKSQKDGLDCQVGDRGVRFSGGQRQRMAIARALYEEPEIIILDEATAALDNETEIAVMESIENLKGIKTLIIIAHRLTTIKNCNRICEIVDGKIKDRTYGELVK